MPLIVLTASSILSVMSVSISSGAAPTRRVVIVIVGMSTFGNRSTPSCRYAKYPTTTSERMMTVAKTGRLTQISASLCMVSFLRLQASGFRRPDASCLTPDASPGLHLHSREQTRPQFPVAIRELGLDEERARGGIDHAADDGYFPAELLRRIRIDARFHRLSGTHGGEIFFGNAEA